MEKNSRLWCSRTAQGVSLTHFYNRKEVPCDSRREPITRRHLRCVARRTDPYSKGWTHVFPRPEWRHLHQPRGRRTVCARRGAAISSAAVRADERRCYLGFL